MRVVHLFEATLSRLLHLACKGAQTLFPWEYTLEAISSKIVLTQAKGERDTL